MAESRRCPSALHRHWYEWDFTVNVLQRRKKNGSTYRDIRSIGISRGGALRKPRRRPRRLLPPHHHLTQLRQYRHWSLHYVQYVAAKLVRFLLQLHPLDGSPHWCCDKLLQPLLLRYGGTRVLQFTMLHLWIKKPRLRPTRIRPMVEIPVMGLSQESGRCYS